MIDERAITGLCKRSYEQGQADLIAVIIDTWDDPKVSGLDPMTKLMAIREVVHAGREEP